jgi:hypothetical protein
MLRRLGMQKAVVYVDSGTPYEPPGAIGARPYHLQRVDGQSHAQSSTSTYSHVLETSKRLLQNGRGLHVRGPYGHCS